MRKSYLLIVLMLLFACNISAQKKKSNTKPKNQTTEQKSVSAVDSLKTIVAQAESGNAAAQNVVGSWYYKGEHYDKDYTKALKWWTASAQQQYPEAFGNLGLLYQYGRGVEADSVKALKFYVSSISKGNVSLLKQREVLAEKEKDAFDCVLVAVCYQEGKGVDANLTKAVHFYELAANENSEDAYRELGFICQKQKQTETALNMFKKAADLGDVSSTYQYAKTILNSKSRIDNEQEAVVYLMRAAEKGNAQAQCGLGTLYIQGKHVNKDPNAAVKWFKKSSVSEWALGQWNLALCYIDGLGTERDFDQAIYWLGEATSRGYMSQFEKKCADADRGWKEKPFMSYLQGMSLYLDKKDIEGAYEEFKKIKKESVEAQNLMAVCLASKNAKKPNAKKAVKELEKISATGNNLAKFYLGTLYENGNGTEKDMDKAKSLYQESANGGCAKAQCYMGNLFYEGRLVDQSYSEAVRYYQLAEEQGQLTEAAATRYAQCYEQGLGGLKVDVNKASELKGKDFKNHIVPMLRKIN